MGVDRFWRDGFEVLSHQKNGMVHSMNILIKRLVHSMQYALNLHCWVFLRLPRQRRPLGAEGMDQNQHQNGRLMG